MAGESTAGLIFAPRTIWGELHGEAGGRIWRPGFAAFLVEKHVPLWVVTPVAHASNSNPAHTIISCNPDLDGPLEMNLMPFMASIFSNDVTLKEQAKREGALHEEEGSWWITDYEMNHATVEEHDEDGEIEDHIMYSDTIFPSSKIYEMSFRIAPNCLRVSTMIYPNSFLDTNGGIAWMRSIGIDVDVFSLTKFSAGE
jgi:hypothetical protein